MIVIAQSQNILFLITCVAVGCFVSIVSSIWSIKRKRVVHHYQVAPLFALGAIPALIFYQIYPSDIFAVNFWFWIIVAMFVFVSDIKDFFNALRGIHT